MREHIWRGKREEIKMYGQWNREGYIESIEKEEDGVGWHHWQYVN